MNFAEQSSLNVHFSIRHEKVKQVGRRDFPLFSIRLAYKAPVAQWIEQRFPKPFQVFSGVRWQSEGPTICGNSGRLVHWRQVTFGW